MKQSGKISDAESLVMEVLWSANPRSADEVFAALGPEPQWQEATVKSLLNRLLKKGVLRADKDGRRFLYSPLITREQWIRGESASMIDRLFGGRIAPLVAHFSQDRPLSQSDLTDLKRLIEELGDGK